jgi:hypothetical protein
MRLLSGEVDAASSAPRGKRGDKKPRASTTVGTIADTGLRLRAKTVNHVEMKHTSSNVSLS